MKLTAESVTAYHPDKICDRISDAILDACLEQDPMSRVAVETMGGHGKIYLTGEITTKAEIDPKAIALKVYGRPAKVYSNIAKQSPEIAQGVDTGGAGDQGVMIGYACNETHNYLPEEMYIARSLLAQYDVDGKSQVVLNENREIESIVLSVMGKTQDDLKAHVYAWLMQSTAKLVKTPHIYCNNTGSFDIGGFDADAGMTGRKIVVDAYGPRVPVGGGAFSGKDPSKVDRSAAYMARWVALQLLKKYGAKEVLVKLGYVIGNADPLIKTAIVDGVEEEVQYDCRPNAIIERFQLRRPIYLDTATHGHFGRTQLPWEQT